VIRPFKWIDSDKACDKRRIEEMRSLDVSVDVPSKFLTVTLLKIRQSRQQRLRQIATAKINTRSVAKSKTDQVDTIEDYYNRLCSASRVRGMTSLPHACGEVLVGLRT
jgi:hypothetical protein